MPLLVASRPLSRHLSLEPVPDEKWRVASLKGRSTVGMNLNRKTGFLVGPGNETSDETREAVEPVFLEEW